MQPAELSLRNVRKLLAGILLACTGAALAQPWQPSKSVEFIVPAGPGGALDQVGRIMKQVFDEKQVLGSQTLLVIDKPGGGGKIAFNTLAQREGDGHVLTISTHGYLATYIGGTLDVLPHRDFTPLGVLLDESVVVAVRADAPYKTVQDLVAQLKRTPEKLPIGVAAAVGNHIHVGIAKPLKTAGVDIKKLTVVAFRSSGESLTALLGGHIDIVAASTPNVVTLYRAGKIRLLAISSAERLGGVLADVPTWREAGVNAVFHSSLGILGAKGLSPAQIAFWDRALRTLSDSDEWKRQMERTQSRPHYLNHADALKFYEEEYNSMRALLSDMGLAKQ